MKAFPSTNWLDWQVHNHRSTLHDLKAQSIESKNLSEKWVKLLLRIPDLDGL